MRRLISNMWDGLGMSRAAAIGPQHLAMSIRRGPFLWLMWWGVVVAAAIVVSGVVVGGGCRERALNNSGRGLKTPLLLLPRHFDQQFEDSEIIANDLAS